MLDECARGLAAGLAVGGICVLIVPVTLAALAGPSVAASPAKHATNVDGSPRTDGGQSEVRLLSTKDAPKLDASLSMPLLTSSRSTVPARSSTVPARSSTTTIATIDDVERHITLLSFEDATALQAARHRDARERCSLSSSHAAHAGSIMQSGGWCLGLMVREQRYGSEGVVHLPSGSYKLPATHVPADRLILAFLRNLTDGFRQSVLDLGAGVGQYGHALVPEGLQWRGYDGAGDVEDYTGGYVRYADLTAPMALPQRADWVLCLEVGEHVPRESELMLVRNLHAHNRCGILLSWACCVSGSGHINQRPNGYVIGLFDRLGYSLARGSTKAVRNVRVREALRHNRSSHVYGWFSSSLLLFVRRDPPPGCSRV